MEATPEKHVTGVFFTGFTAMSSNESRGFTVYVAMLQQCGRISKYEINATFNVTVPQVLFAVM